MRSSIQSILILSMIVSAGCSICPPGYLDDYATVGGKWQRSDPAYGRVGSIFSDPGSTQHSGMQSTGTYSDGYANEYYEPGEVYSSPESSYSTEPYEFSTPDYGTPEPIPGNNSSGYAPIPDETIILGDDL